jgi:hypothetical protein
MRYLLIIAALFCSLPQISAQNNIAYGAGISYTNGAPSFTPPARTSRVAIDTVTGKWYHFNTPGGWQLLGNTIEEIAGCTAPAYTPTKGDSKVVINNCTTPEVYFYNGSTWVQIGGGSTLVAGEGIRIQNDSIILDSLYTLRFRTGSATDGEAGRLTWDANEGTIDVVLNAGSVTGQMFEDVFFNCKNQTGSTITRGTVVMAVGTLGASGRILIAPAIADGSVNSEYILGTAAQDIANGSDGLVYHFGKDRGLNTTGASCGETWADRDVLYCSATTPGCLTKVLPTAPNLKVPVAFVIRAGNNGTLFIRPSHFPDLNQINDVQLTSPTTGQTLIYNASTGVWSNQTPADPSPTNELQTLSTGTNTLTLSNGGGTVTVDTDPSTDVTGSGTSGQVPFWTGAQTQGGDNNLWWDNSLKRLGVGSTSPTAPLFVKSTGNSSSTNIAVQFQNSQPVTPLNILTILDNGNVGLGGQTSPTSRLDILGGLRLGTTTVQFGFGESGGNSIFLGSLTNHPYRFVVFTNEVARFTTGGNLLIGNTTGTARLHVVGSSSTSSTWTAQFHNSTGSSNSLMIRDDGNVGIGTSSPTSRLHVGGAGSTRLEGSVRYGSSADGPQLFTYTTANGTPVTSGTNLAFYNYTGALAAPQGAFSFNGDAFRQTTGTNQFWTISHNFNPTSGNATYSTFYLNPRVNQTGTAAGITQGLLISPTITNATDFRAFEISALSTGYSMYISATAPNYIAGNLGLGTTSPTDNLDINGANGYSQLRLRTAYTPTGTADANGNTGDVAWDANYIYIKTAAGWKRSALSTF